jgi:amidase
MPGPHARLRRRLRTVSPEELRQIGSADYINLTVEDAEGYAAAVNAEIDTIDQLMAMPVDAPPTVWRDRDPGRAVQPGEDPYNAFVRYCRVVGAEAGPLSGLQFGVKDNMAVAGVPTSNGSSIASSVAGSDATVIDRLLSAGATLVGKTNLDDLSSGATGETSVFGPARNPVNAAYSCGGSSGGSAAAVAGGLVDFSLGADQGGSVRIPASYTGIVGVIATHGLVPTYGLTHLDHSIDYIGPMARDVETVARALDVITGPDPLDSQWTHGVARPTRCVDHLGDGVRGFRIAVITDSVEEEDCGPDVLANFQSCLHILRGAGASIEQTSVPLWKYGWPIETVLLAALSSYMNMSDGVGYGHRGYVDEVGAHTYALARRLEADAFPPAYKFWLLMGRYLQVHNYGVAYRHAQNLRYALTQELRRRFEQYDLLVTPTTPHTAVALATELRSDPEFLRAHGGGNFTQNTAPTNLTGNPSLAMPSGLDSAGLPTSIQFVAPAYCDERNFAAAAALQAGLQLERTQRRPEMSQTGGA